MNFTKKLIEAEDIFSCEQNILDIKVWFQLITKQSSINTCQKRPNKLYNIFEKKL